MKRITIIGLLLIIATALTSVMAECQQDSTLRTIITKKNTIKVIEEEGKINVQVFEKKDTTKQLKKVYEGVFTDEQEYEKWSVKTPVESILKGIGVLNKKAKRKKRRKRYAKPRWAGLGWGFCTITDGSQFDDIDGMSLKGEKSNEFVWNIANVRLTPKHEHFVLSTGLGLDWKNLHFENNSRLVEINNVTGMAPAPVGIHYDFARLRVFYVTVPLIATFQPTRSLFVSAGVVGGINAFTNQRLKYRNITGEYVKKNNKKGLNVARFSCDFIGQVGYGSFGFFAKYSPISLFQKDKGPEVQTASLGLKIFF